MHIHIYTSGHTYMHTYIHTYTHRPMQYTWHTHTKTQHILYIHILTYTSTCIQKVCRSLKTSTHRAHADLNHGPADLQSAALPLNYTPAVTFIQPTTNTLLIHTAFWRTTLTPPLRIDYHTRRHTHTHMMECPPCHIDLVNISLRLSPHYCHDSIYTYMYTYIKSYIYTYDHADMEPHTHYASHTHTHIHTYAHIGWHIRTQIICVYQHTHTRLFSFM